MAALIDSTYFTEIIAVPSSKYGNDIDTYINRYEEEILTGLLGYSLYKDFIAGIGVGSPDQKWLDLRDGVEYEINYNGDTRTVKWNGLINAAKVSLIAFYIYWQYKKVNTTITTNVGGVDPKSENSVRVIERQKLVEVWNRMIAIYGRCTDSELKPTAYNFLNEHFEDDYPNWEFTEEDRVNEFDI